MSIGLSFAFLTLGFKKTTYHYYNQELEEFQKLGVDDLQADGGLNAAYHVMLIYWLLFIYLSLSAMDEMIELFSVINQLEKGALGLFFEMNYFVGVALAGYIAWFIQKFDAPKFEGEGEDTENMQAKFDNMYNWLYFQYLYLYLCTIVGLGVYAIYKNMDSKAEAKIKEKSDKQPKASTKHDDGA